MLSAGGSAAHHDIVCRDITLIAHGANEGTEVDDVLRISAFGEFVWPLFFISSWHNASKLKL